MSRVPAPLLAAALLHACAGAEGPATAGGGGGAGGAGGAPGGSGGAPVADSCDRCHGADGDPAPPPGLDGAVDPRRRGVGAHRAHLAAGDHAEIRCAHCHVVPRSVDAAGHRDGARPADVTFSGLAARRVEASTSDAGCVVYCHGGGLRAERRTSPPWTSAAPLACDGCHGLPPPAPHPADDRCPICHLGVVDADRRIVSRSRHVDSVLAAPAAAHVVHLGGGGGPALACTTCHADADYLLRDGRVLEETTVCDGCHGAADAPAWRAHRGLAELVGGD